jgi:hypothetical protein
MSLTIEYASTAQCRPEHVWQVFHQIELWPRWDPQAIRDVRWVSGEPWTKGAKFSIEMLKPFSFKLTPEVLDVQSPIYVHLQGKGSGVTGVQHFIFKWMPDQQATELRTLQQLSGGPISLLGKSLKAPIEAGIRFMFSRIIEEAEAIARTAASAPAPGRFAAILSTEPTPPVGDPEPPSGEPVPPVGDPIPPAVDPIPPIDDPVPAPHEPVPPTGDPVPPVGDPAPPPRDAPFID